jgi:hypothetical protein
MKYLAIKVKGLNHWLWFNRSEVTEEDGIFIGKSGWGKDKELTNITIPVKLIQARLESDALQH